MIPLQLQCHDEHVFEAWFKNSQACDTQAKIGLIECPYCGSTQIHTDVELREAVDVEPAPKEQEDVHARAHEVAQQILEAVGKLRNYAEENFEPAKPAKSAEATSNKAKEIQSVEDDESALDEGLADVEGQSSRSHPNDQSD